MEIKDFRASFRVEHPSWTAEKITERILINASVVHGIGEIRKSSKGGNYESTYISYKLDVERYCSIEAFLEDTLKAPFLKQGVIEDIVATGGNVFFYISIFCSENAGFSLNPSIISQLASKNIALDFDIYPEIFDIVPNK